jgi:hypothetical protein
MIKTFQRFPCPEIMLNLAVSRKQRWPFGFEILREFSYPADYPYPIAADKVEPGLPEVPAGNLAAVV